MEYLVTDLNTLKEKKVIQAEIAYRDILVIYTEEGIYALQDKCPHRGISLVNGTIKEDVIRCKDHGLPISIKTGKVTNQRQANFLRLDNHSRSIPTYPVSVKDNNVFVSI
ncbi:MAG: Rieske 2Fe-2S domain-containing protein [Candidatus Izimaplasma sp.]|nr:Rieske 2Fe-2S domain-containing protein [Candidatus Izimaplasma bacterium]